MKYAPISLAIGQLIGLLVLLTGCAGAQISIGGGSFGGSGGIGGSVTTEVPAMGGDDSPPLPIIQVPLSDTVIAAVFPDKNLPFTAEGDDVEALAKHVDSGAKPVVSDETKGKLDKCVAEEARCRIRSQE